MLNCVLFDFDGVIADTEPGTMAYLERAFEQLGIALTEHDWKGYIGQDGSIHTAHILKRNHCNVSVDEFLEQKRGLGNYYEDSKELQAYQGVVDLLCWLRGKGVKTGLVSSTGSRLILTALNRMSMTALFDVVICGDMVTRKKPSPEGYEKAMEYLGISNRECLIIEDSPTGIQAAKSAGGFVVGLKCSRIEQDTSKADKEISSYAALKQELMKKMNLSDE